VSSNLSPMRHVSTVLESLSQYWLPYRTLMDKTLAAFVVTCVTLLVCACVLSCAALFDLRHPARTVDLWHDGRLRKLARGGCDVRF
jgi:hypothetical protein